MNEAELIRLLSSLVMVGVVAELDEEDARVRIDVDGMRTDWIPWGERRAGPGVRTWCAPEVNEQVVIVCPYGDPSQAVIVGSIYQQTCPAPANLRTIHRTIYADGTVIEYDREAHAFRIDVGTGSVTVNCGSATVVASEGVTVECATATVTASDSVTLDTPTTHATGDLNVDGNVSVQGNADVVGDVTAANVTARTEVTAGAITLTGHRHTATGPTAPTTPAQP